MRDDAEGPIERALRGLGRRIPEHPRWLLVVLALTAVPAALLAMRLETRASFLDLLPADETPVVQLRQVLTEARATSDVSIAISTEDRDLAERFAEALSEELAADPAISGVGGHLDPDFFLDRRLLFVPEADLERLVADAESAIDRELLRNTGLYIDLEDTGAPTTEAMLAEVDRGANAATRDEWIVTSDGRYLALWAFFAGNSGDLAFGQSAIAHVDGAIARARTRTGATSLETRLAGGIPTRVADEASFRRDLGIAGTVGFVTVLLLIVASLRAPRALLILGGPLFLGLLWTFAFARVAVGHLNIISGFLFSILSGLGIEYGIHLLHRYRELREEGLDLEHAMEELVARTGRALFTGSLTNAAVFTVIALAQFQGFNEFGAIAAVGLLLTFVSTLLGVPALLCITERISPLRTRGELESRGSVSLPAWLRTAVLVMVPAAALASGALIARGDVRFDGNWRVLTGSSETSRFQEYLRHHFAGLFTSGLVLVEDDAELDAIAQVIHATRDARRREGRPTLLEEVATLHLAFPAPEAQARRAELARQLGAQLERIPRELLDDGGRHRLDEGLRLVRAAQPVSIDALPYAVVGSFMTTSGRGSIAHLRVRETDDAGTSVLTAWADEVREYGAALDAAGHAVPILSENWIAGEIFERIARDARFLGVGTILAVLAVLWLDLRRLRLALAVLGSVLLGVLAMAAGLWLVGVQLNFMNVAILPVCVGISLDNAIHVTHRWIEGGPGSIPKVLAATAKSNALASATNLLGFAALGLTEHPGLRSVAWLAVLGVACTYISTTLWYPLVLDTLDRYAALRR